MMFWCTKENLRDIPTGCIEIRFYGRELDQLILLLKTNTTIKELILHSNQIGDQGAKEIAKVLKTNETITDLYLSYNNIKDEGAIAIAEALKNNFTVTTVYLHGNPIRYQGMKEIAEILKFNYTITTFFLYNPIGDLAELAIKTTLEKNRTVTDRRNIDDKCKKMTLGLLSTIPIYLLLTIFEHSLVLELEKEMDCPISIEDNNFLKYLQRNGSEKRWIKIIDKLGRLICNKYFLV